MKAENLSEVFPLRFRPLFLTKKFALAPKISNFAKNLPSSNVHLSQFKNIYFLGIGGIGMSALARWWAAQGYQVAGYDRSPSPLTEQLAQEGLHISYQEDPESLPPNFLQAQETLVVYTPAIAPEQALLRFFQAQGYRLMKRAEALGLISRRYFTIAVAGTHGKTTTSAMVAHLLKHSGMAVNAFVGGLMQNYQSNLLIGSPDAPLVVEADEYDRSFLALHPDIAIVTATDADHLDIYGHEEAVLDSFRQFVQNIKAGGKLFVRQGLPDLQSEESKLTEIKNFEIESGDYALKNLQIRDNALHFEIHSPKQLLDDLHLHLPGAHNLRNALAAVAVAEAMGLSAAQVRAGLASFGGVKRRFEYIFKSSQKVYIDDYAHHPEELKALLQAARQFYPEARIALAFQPHLFSRTRDFAAAFAESLALADELYLLEIYPAREGALPGITAAWLLAQVPLAHKYLVSKEALPQRLAESRAEVLITAGAGDIDRSIQAIAAALAQKNSSYA